MTRRDFFTYTTEASPSKVHEEEEWIKGTENKRRRVTEVELRQVESKACPGKCYQ